VAERLLASLEKIHCMDCASFQDYDVFSPRRNGMYFGVVSAADKSGDGGDDDDDGNNNFLQWDFRTE
jgi:hypothetical protein